MKFTFLGTGTSHGVPVIACDCRVCKSSDKKDKRYRASAYVQCDDGNCILIDVGPEFRIQALENNIRKIDAVLLTHSHADHLHGIDDLRIFSTVMYKVPTDPKSRKQYDAPPIPIYTNENTLNDVKNRFGYIFSQVTEGGGVAKLNLILAESSFYIGKTRVTPVPMMHGHLPTCGFLLTEEKDGIKKSLAYLTDCSFISDESFNLIINNAGILEHVVIDGLRKKEHSTHFNFIQSMRAAEKLNAKNTWLTHITHENTHQDIEDFIEENLKDFPNLQKSQGVHPAYDGLQLNF